jgi:hypothetical protein
MFVSCLQTGMINYLFLPWRNSTSGPGTLHYLGFTITSDTRHSVGLLWTSDQPDAETSTWQHTTVTTDRHPCLQRDSNPRSQQRATADSPLRPRFHWDRHWLSLPDRKLNTSFQRPPCYFLFTLQKKLSTFKF